MTEDAREAMAFNEDQWANRNAKIYIADLDRMGRQIEVIDSGELRYLSIPKSIRFMYGGAFSWGPCGGFGGVKLAFAILLDVTGSEDVAFDLMEKLDRAFIMFLGNGWNVTSEELQGWIEKPSGPVIGRERRVSYESAIRSYGV